MDEGHLHHPLLPTTATTTTATRAPPANGESITSNFGLGLRLLVIISVGIISTWANYEASKGFIITVSNDMKNTPAGEKFSLFYISNDEATRLVQSASDFATRILCFSTNSIAEKLIDGVDIRLGNDNLTHGHRVRVESIGPKNKYVLSLSPLILEFSDFKYRIRREIQRGMAEIMLISGSQSNVPMTLVDGMVEYISNLAGFDDSKQMFKLKEFTGKCWEDKDPRIVANFLGYCEGKSEGFIERLNLSMKGGWDEGIVDRALGLQAEDLCDSFRYALMKDEGLIHPLESESVSAYR